jgi:hypothetical protein
MWKATAGSLALRPELLPCALQIPSHDGHPALGYITRLAFDYERTLTSKLMLLHGTNEMTVTMVVTVIYMNSNNVKRL